MANIAAQSNRLWRFPYQGLSAFAGNPLFIDLDDLKKLGLVKAQDLNTSPDFPVSVVAYNRVRRSKRKVLELAFSNFKRSNKTALQKEFEQFKLDANYWLEDFSVFMALREQFKLVSWSDWPDPYRLRDPQALLDFEEVHSQEIEMQAFFQFLFFKQWYQLKQYANDKGIQIIGDIPIFMGFDSADVWANSHLFKMDKDRRPTFVAGVPPDFFSKTGQLWGNPVYEWQEHSKEDYGWWINRVAETLIRPWTLSAWTISAASPAFTRFLLRLKLPNLENGSKVRERVCLTPLKANWVNCPLSLKI